MPFHLAACLAGSDPKAPSEAAPAYRCFASLRAYSLIYTELPQQAWKPYLVFLFLHSILGRQEHSKGCTRKARQSLLVRSLPHAGAHHVCISQHLHVVNATRRICEDSVSVLLFLIPCYLLLTDLVRLSCKPASVVPLIAKVPVTRASLDLPDSCSLNGLLERHINPRRSFQLAPSVRTG